VIEVEVHQQLRAFLREQGEPYWPHHLTMARLVARALRLGRSALIQAGAPSGYHGRYRLSYVMPALIWNEAAILVASESVQQRLLMVEIPRLRQWISTPKAIHTGDRWPEDDFQGLLLTSPQSWLADRLEQQQRFPSGIPTIIDSAEDLEGLAQQHLTVTLTPADWEMLMLACPDQTEEIRNVRVQLTCSLFQRPINPHGYYLIEPPEQAALTQLYQQLHPFFRLLEPKASSPSASPLPDCWQLFWRQMMQEGQLLWAEIQRQQGCFTIHCAPVDVAATLSPVWQQQPVVLIGGALDLDSYAPIYRQRLGLPEITCVKFSPDRQNELIQLYLPDKLPMPNTPQFQSALIQELRSLLAISVAWQGLTVVVVDDMPLKAQASSILAAEFGSRVQVEKTCLDDQGILITGWKFWRQHQAVLPAPCLLAIATLPIPSLENPLVAGRVAYYKQQRQDWFRLYLLPEALSELQRAVSPLRETQGVVALFDNRVNHRSYGQLVLNALSPLARVNYVDPTLFNQIDCPILE
jgi:ATP-dependent DNA helicase DinG